MNVQRAHHQAAAVGTEATTSLGSASPSSCPSPRGIPHIVQLSSLKSLRKVHIWHPQRSLRGGSSYPMIFMALIASTICATLCSVVVATGDVFTTAADSVVSPVLLGMTLTSMIGGGGGNSEGGASALLRDATGTSAAAVATVTAAGASAFGMLSSSSAYIS